MLITLFSKALLRWKGHAVIDIVAEYKTLSGGAGAGQLPKQQHRLRIACETDLHLTE